MEVTTSHKKSILKSSDSPFQRSSSLSVGSDTYSPNPKFYAPDTPKKHTVILDENGVFRPGEQDENDTANGKHNLQSSVADRTAGERVSCRLIQQRSLDLGLYNELNKCQLENVTCSGEFSKNDTGTDSEESPSSTKSAAGEYEITGRLLTSHSPSEDVVLKLIKSKEDAKPFSLRDILAHRVPELKDDEECTNGTKEMSSDLDQKQL